MRSRPKLLRREPSPTAIVGIVLVAAMTLAGCGSSAAHVSPLPPPSPEPAAASTTPGTSTTVASSAPGLHGIIVLSCPSDSRGDYLLTAYSSSGTTTGSAEFNVPQTPDTVDPVAGSCAPYYLDYHNPGPQVARSAFNSDYSRLATGTGYVAAGSSTVTEMAPSGGFSGAPPLSLGFYVAPTDTYAAAYNSAEIDSVSEDGNLATLATFPSVDEGDAPLSFGAYGKVVVGGPSGVLGQYNDLVASLDDGGQLSVEPLSSYNADSGQDQHLYPMSCTPWAWVSNTRILCFAQNDSGNYVGIYNTAVGGTTLNRLTPDTSQRIASAAVSPDGQSFAFIGDPAGDSSDTEATLYTGSTSILGPPTTVTQLSAPSTLVAWGP